MHGNRKVLSPKARLPKSLHDELGLEIQGATSAMGAGHIALVPTLLLRRHFESASVLAAVLSAVRVERNVS